MRTCVHGCVLEMGSGRGSGWLGRLVLFKECEHTFRFSHRCKDTQTLICRSAGQMVLELGQLLPWLPPPESNKRQASGPCPADQQQVGGL